MLRSFTHYLEVGCTGGTTRNRESGMTNRELESYIGCLYKNPKLEDVLFVLVSVNEGWNSHSHVACIVRTQNQLFSDRDLVLPAGVAFKEESLVLGGMKTEIHYIGLGLGNTCGRISKKYLPFIQASVNPSFYRTVLPPSAPEGLYTVTIKPGVMTWSRNL